MTKHYSEADLLETYYTQPGESMPVMMHLASCADCAARYDRLDRKLREAATCSTERPATFWSRQRLSIMKKIGAQRSGARRGIRTWRLAAAVTLAFLLGGAFTYEMLAPKHQTPAPAAAVTAEAATTTEPATVDPAEEALQPPRDPWESDELQEFRGVVQWESWVAETKNAKGDASL